MQDNTPSRKHAPAVALPQAISTRSGLLDLQVGREGKTGKSRLYTRSRGKCDLCLLNQAMIVNSRLSHKSSWSFYFNHVLVVVKM